MNVDRIQPQQLQQLHASGRKVELIDVRTPVEFSEMHAVNARNVPLDSLDPQGIAASRNGNGEPLYLICGSGRRAEEACEQFIAAGYTNVANVDGGTRAWERAGLPVIRNPRAFSLERQVRIAAGLIVLVGAVLALTVNPWFAAVSGFVGAGLAFAGITNTCGMAMLLAHMPWNKSHGGCGSACDSE